MSIMKTHLDALLQEVRTLQEKYSQEWVKIDREVTDLEKGINHD